MRRGIYDEDHEAFRSSVKEFLDREVVPHLDEHAGNHRLPREFWLAAGKQGLLGLEVPEEYGGAGAGDFRFNAVLTEELAKVNMTLPSCVGIHTDIVAPYLVELTTDEIDASFWITLWFISAEKPRPPYSFGMFRPKNFSRLTNAHISGGRSARTWVMSQSSTMRHSCSHGPSRYACSSAVSCGFGCDSSSRQSGLPENSWPSKPTVPDSSAVRSVSDSGGRMRV